MRVKIAKWGNASAVRIPKDALARAGFAEGQEVEIDATEGGLRLRAVRRQKSVAELFDEARRKGPLTPPAPLDFGLAVGHERWPDDDWSDIAPSDEEMGIGDDASGRRSRPGRR